MKERLALPIYHFYELNHALLSPFRAMADLTKLAFSNPLNPLTHTALGRGLAATAEVFERTTRRYGKPEWEIDSVEIDGHTEEVRVQTVWSRP
ncbi:MAG TPA: polyhydroxyalkanoate depolymerase, partial [Kaistiaceae bacterium]|nr:polyhydroxyalkanoate depolymerase [Kaistiaceae bacterium]